MKKRLFWCAMIGLACLVGIVDFGCIYLMRESFDDSLDGMSASLYVSKEEDSVLDVPRVDLEYYRKFYGNEEIVGKIVLPSSSLDVLFSQAEDNEYYLTHRLNREEYTLGSVFMDYRVGLDSRKILLYGHNSRYHDTEFKVLENFMEEDYYQEHKYLEVVTDEMFYRYEIFSVMLVSDDFSYFDVTIDDYISHILSLKKNSIYDTGVVISGMEDLLILQTCSNRYRDHYVVVCAKKIFSYEY